jgi:Protein of unknown function (DUF3617)
MRRMFVGAAALLFAAASPALAQSPRLDGDWDIKVTMDMGGQTMEMPSRQCLTKEDAANPLAALPSGPQGQNGCKMVNHKVTAQTVTFSMTCDGGPAPLKTDGELVYKGDTYNGTLTTVSGGQKMVMKIAGKRLGDCNKAAPPKP